MTQLISLSCLFYVVIDTFAVKLIIHLFSFENKSVVVEYMLANVTGSIANASDL